MLNTVEIHEDAIENVTMKIASDIQDFLAGSGDVMIDFDTIEIMTDDVEVEIEVDIIEDEIDLHVSLYKNFTNYEEHNTETVSSIVAAVEYAKTLF